MMKFKEFDDMMRRVKLVSPGDHEQFAVDVIVKVAQAGGVEPIPAGYFIVMADGKVPAPTPAPTPQPTASGFRFGAASLAEQKGVHPILLKVANRAIEITTQDFIFFDGVRSYKEQQANIAKGVSKTLDSKHLPQADGFGHAMDLVPYIDGRAQWDWDGCYRVAMAVDQAATEQGVARLIRWGGAWDRTLDKFGGDQVAYAVEVQKYKSRHPGPDFLDGPHFELVGVK
jgi:peptidoglycan L-alanyl-D-glutamate endopeptidase CwlK